jgi:3-hydroxyacyl-CoA dehydrogenase
MKPVVGIIGLGAMGLGIAQSVRRAGFGVQVFDLRREVATAFVRDGGTACSSSAARSSSRSSSTPRRPKTCSSAAAASPPRCRRAPCS